MWWHVLVLVVVTCALTNAVHYTSVNVMTPLQTCPSTPGVVCSDVYTYNQTGGNTPGQNVRTVNRCACAGGCPTSENHTVYDSRNHRLRLCTLPTTWTACSNRQASRVLHIQDADFNFVTYITIHCLCPRHRAPVMTSNHPSGRVSHLDTATTFFRNGHFNGHPTHQYACRRLRRRGRGRGRGRGRRGRGRRRRPGRR